MKKNWRKVIYKIFCLTLILSLLSGCSSKELSRNKATKLIKEHFDEFKGIIQYELPIILPIQAFWLSPTNDENSANVYKNYVDNGMLSRETPFIIYDRFLGRRYVWPYTLTDKAKQYNDETTYEYYWGNKKYDMQYNVIAYTISFGEITGIEDAPLIENEKIVHFKFFIEPTPFAENGNTMEYESEASFKLFDDGWRLDHF